MLYHEGVELHEVPFFQAQGQDSFQHGSVLAAQHPPSQVQKHNTIPTRYTINQTSLSFSYSFLYEFYLQFYVVLFQVRTQDYCRWDGLLSKSTGS